MNEYTTISIPAAVAGQPGVVVQPVYSAKEVFVLASTADFKIRSDTGKSVTLGTGRSMRSAEPMSLITFYNDGTSAVQVTFFAGEDYGANTAPPAGTAIGEAPIILADAQTQLQMPNGSTFNYPGIQTFSGLLKTRKFMEVDNLNGIGAPVSVFVGGSRIARVWNSQCRRFETADTITLQTLNGAADVSVYEVF